MNKLSLLIAMLLLAGAKASIAQVDPATQHEMDSLQRIVMKDSLGIDDAVVSHVFQVRNSYFIGVQNIRVNSSLTSLQKETEIHSIRMQTDEQIKSVLGIEAYEKYDRIIKGKLGRRNRVQGSALTK